MDNDLLYEVNELFEKQTEEWPLAKKNFLELTNVLTKEIKFDNFVVKVQFNPARMVSSGARTDTKAIAERPCFLCRKNRPSEQRYIEWREYDILVNPFPIFKRHLTIARHKHEEQQIKPYIGDMIDVAEQLKGYIIFYNGPHCGASAPDHAHFQAGETEFTPITEEYFRLKNSHGRVILKNEKAEVCVLENYLRTVYCIESSESEKIKEIFATIYNTLAKKSSEAEEPMINVLCMYKNEKWYLFIFPRKTFRPRQYGSGTGQLLVSPATVEMSGVFITPIKEHFENITQEDIKDIFSQITTSGTDN